MGQSYSRLAQSETESVKPSATKSPATTWQSVRRCLIIFVVVALIGVIGTIVISSSSRSVELEKDETDSSRENVEDLIKEADKIDQDTANGAVVPEEESDTELAPLQGDDLDEHLNSGDDEGLQEDDAFEPAPRTHEGPYNEMVPGEKYFLYSPSGGFNNQREELTNAMEIARVLNRTLYVPMAARHTSFYSVYERLSGPADLFPMDRILDFPHMEAYGVRTVPLNTTVLRMAARFAKEMGPNSVEILYHPSLPNPVESWHLDDVVQLRRFKKPLLFIRGKGFYHHWFSSGVLTRIRKHTRYSEYLRRLSMRIVDEAIGKPFYAMHVRLGDYKVKYGDHVSSFIAGLVSTGRNHNWKTRKFPLYLATDDARKSRADFGPIYSAFSKYYVAETLPKDLVKEYRSLFPPRSMMKDDMFGLLEQLICVQASDFVGSPGSTFSAWIMTMRALRKFTFPEVGAVGESAADIKEAAAPSSDNSDSELSASVTEVTTTLAPTPKPSLRTGNGPEDNLAANESTALP